MEKLRSTSYQGGGGGTMVVAHPDLLAQERGGGSRGRDREPVSADWRARSGSRGREADPQLDPQAYMRKGKGREVPATVSDLRNV